MNWLDAVTRRRPAPPAGDLCGYVRDHARAAKRSSALHSIVLDLWQELKVPHLDSIVNMSVRGTTLTVYVTGASQRFVLSRALTGTVKRETTTRTQGAIRTITIR